MVMQIVTFMSWIAIPVALITIIDDWFRRPFRQIASAPQRAPDPKALAALYYVLPLFAAAAVIRLLVAERLDFSAVLLGITVATGVIWAIDALFVRKRRAAAALEAGKEFNAIPEPGTVDYARSFFPVALVVLLLRSFIFEPFRIPSDSMMPTLVDGDFIIVNKYAYGLRLPVLNRKFVPVGEPRRGDVVVFRYPLDPSVNYIKRLVGLPGDHVEVENDRITVNGKPVQFDVTSRYNDGCYVNFQEATEHLGEHVHQSLLCPVPLEITPDPPPGCNRKETRGYLCGDHAVAGLFGEPQKFSKDVPQGMYFMMGDNRDNATRIWFNYDLQRSGGPTWSRIGKAIE
jgi:signal peptidase I